MLRLGLLVCLVSVASAQVDPRGARPVEHGTRSEKCATQKEWPFCTDDEWGSKCPSGCRIQGLLDQYDHGVVKRIELIRQLLDQNKARHRSADTGSKQTYDYLREKLTLDSGNNNNYYDLAQSLRQRITDMKIKIDRQIRILAALKDRVKDQVTEMQRLEVDIDIKLRSCKGSCATYSEHQVDQDGYVTLDKQINQLDSQSAQNIESVGSLYVMKSRPLQGVLVDSIYKSGVAAAQQKEDLFPEVNTVHLILEEEGSSSSPATISKDPDCVDAHQNHLTGETNGLFKIKPGRGDSAAVVEVYCQQEGIMGGWLLVQQRESGTLDFNRTWAEYRGGFGSVDAQGKGELWLGNQNLHLLTARGETMLKVELEDREGGVASAEYMIRVGPEDQGFPLHVSGYTGDAGDALAPTHNGMKFSTFDKDEDRSEGSCAEQFGGGWWYNSCQSANLNGIYSKSPNDPRTTQNGVVWTTYKPAGLKSVRMFIRSAAFLCLRLKQQNQDGRQSVRRQQCQATPNVPMCSDDDWVSRCPSGCRLQGLIWQTGAAVESKLWTACQMAKTLEDATEKSMRATASVYDSQRQLIVGRYTSEMKFAELADGLSGNFTSLRKRSTSSLRQLEELSSNIRQQMEELYRTEVDIDMKLRACRGSCQSALPFDVDHSGYQTLLTDMDETLSRRNKATVSPADIPHIKLQPVGAGVVWSGQYKTIPTVQRELLTQFEDIGQNRFTLEEAVEAAELE